MKHKRFFVLLTVLAMLASSMTAFAGEIQGDVNYVNTEVYKITLPTTEGMSFILDPQGLASLDEGAHDASKAGLIVGTGTMSAINESSVPVLLNTSFYVTDTDDSQALTLSNDGSISSQSAKEMSLEIAVSVSAGDVSSGDGLSAITSTQTIYVESVSAGDPTNTGYRMSAATYSFGGNKTDGYTYDLTADTGSIINMTIGGKVAKDYKWDAYDEETISLNAIFKFNKIVGGDEIENTVASGRTDDYVMALANGEVSYTFVDAPEGSLTNITINGTPRTGQVTSSNITYTAGVLKFNAAAVSTCGLNATGTYEIVATIGGNEIELSYTK